jgi:hypothetical protein
MVFTTAMLRTDHRVFPVKQTIKDQDLDPEERGLGHELQAPVGRVGNELDERLTDHLWTP